MYGYNGFGGFYNGYMPNGSFYPQQQQQQLTQPQMQPQAQPTGNGDERVWVQGEVGAKAYLIAPGATVPLWDSEKPRIFIKSVSSQGVPSMQVINYSVAASDAPAPLPVDNSITERIERLEKAYETLEGQMKGMSRNGSKSDRADPKV